VRPWWWDDRESGEEDEVDLEVRREELRREMCGEREPSELLSLAIYEAVQADWSATSDDVLDMYLRLAKDLDDENEPHQHAVQHQAA